MTLDEATDRLLYDLGFSAPELHRDVVRRHLASAVADAQEHERVSLVGTLRVALDDLHHESSPTHSCGKSCFLTLLDCFAWEAP